MMTKMEKAQITAAVLRELADGLGGGFWEMITNRLNYRAAEIEARGLASSLELPERRVNLRGAA